MAAKSKQDYFEEGRAAFTRGLSLTSVAPTSWQQRAFKDGWEAASKEPQVANESATEQYVVAAHSTGVELKFFVPASASQHALRSHGLSLVDRAKTLIEQGQRERAEKLTLKAYRVLVYLRGLPHERD